MTARPYAPVGRPVDPQIRWQATTLAHSVGPVEAAKRLRMTRGTFAAVVAGLPVAASTEARAAAAFRRRT